MQEDYLNIYIFASFDQRELQALISFSGHKNFVTIFEPAKRS